MGDLRVKLFDYCNYTAKLATITLQGIVPFLKFLGFLKDSQESEMQILF